MLKEFLKGKKEKIIPKCDSCMYYSRCAIRRFFKFESEEAMYCRFYKRRFVKK